MRAIEFRCAGRSDRTELHVISVANGRAMCSCQGVDWCSHIDATLIAGERAMVPETDQRAADRGQRALAGRIHPPEGWQASWRDDRVWRGLAPARGDAAAKVRHDGRPTIMFMGAGPAGNRTEYVEHAASLGWRVVDQPMPLLTLVVTSPEAITTKRGEESRRLSLPMISHEDWDEWCYDVTNAVLDRIEHHGGGARAA